MVTNPSRCLDTLEILYQLLPVTGMQLGEMGTRCPGVVQLSGVLTGRFAPITSVIEDVPRRCCIPRPVLSGLLALLAPVLVLVAVVIGPQVVEALPIRILEYRHDRPTTGGYRVSDGVREHRTCHKCSREVASTV